MRRNTLREPMPTDGAILYGIFRELLAAGMPLGVADYLQALHAVRLDLDGAIPGGGVVSRDGLRRICHVLWARSPDEHRVIDAVFRAVPPASADQVRTLEGEMDRIMGPGAAPREPGAGEAATVAAEADRKQSLRARVTFEPSQGGGGIPLPRLALANGVQPFILQPQTVISERALAVLWRRFRKLTRTGPKTELDVDGTISERCRTGVLDRPIMRARRTNRARLLVLLDASPSMAPWQGFVGAVARSMALSRLDRPGLFYFYNWPKTLYRSSARAGPVATDDVLAEYANASMLVVSDAGAARGFLSHRRVRETQAFLSAANTRTRTAVWINPLPRRRWVGTTAERLSRSGAATFLPLDLAGLIRAVDILRGARSG